MSKLRTVGAINRLQPRISRREAVRGVKDPSLVVDYGVGAVIIDAAGQVWQRDIDNLTTEALELPRGQTYWWKVGSDDDSLTSQDIKLPATLLVPKFDSMGYLNA